MAGISTSVEIVDRVSGSLNRITASLYGTTAAFEAVDRASQTTFNPEGVEAMTREMLGYEERIRQTEADLVDVNRRFEQMQNEIKSAKDGVSNLEGAFSKVGKVVAGLGIGYLVKQQVSQAISYASDLTEVQNVVDTVFGENSTVDSWAKTTLEAVGLNELSAKQFSGTLGAMLSSSGVATDKVEGMSMAMTELAGDMASFYNLDAEEAFNKIRSGISGETEPLKQLGINMSVANLEAYALAQGIETSYSEMSQADQTLLRYNYLLQATANAQGDFARTSDSFSNQTKLLKENWTAFTGQLASKALPVLASGIGILNKGITLISDNWPIIKPIMMGLLGLMGAYTAALVAHKVKQVASAIAEGAATVAKVIHAKAVLANKVAYDQEAIATAQATVAQAGFNTTLLASPVTWVVAGLIALIAVLVSVSNWIAKTTGAAESGIGIVVGALAVAGAFIWNTIVGLLNAIIQFAWTHFVEPWIGVIEFVLNVLNGGFDSFGGMVANLIGQVISWFLSLGKVVTKIIDAIFGTDWTGGLESLQDTVTSWGKNENAITLDRSAPEIEGTIDYNVAWEAGTEWGDGLFAKDTDEIDSAYTDTGAGSLYDEISGIGSDTSDIKDSVDISSENLKYLRDIAEKDAINRFTTAEIRVDMTNHNNISSDMDIDGIITTLSEGLLEEMAATAEGVH